MRIYFDLPIAWLRTPLALIYGLAMLAALFFVKGRWRAMGVIVGGFAVVLAWWFTIKPSNEGDWQPDVAQLAWAEINGDEVTLHNVRNCDYRTETDYDAALGDARPCAYRRSPASTLPSTTGARRGSRIPSSASSSPTRRRSASPSRRERRSVRTIPPSRGLYRQFELIYIVADERDVIRVRTNYRHGEDIYLYRTTATPAQARERFHEYLRSLN